jgi:proteasome activator subunit 4
MIGDLSSTADAAISRPDSVTMLSSTGQSDTIPSFSVHEIYGQEFGIEPRLSNKEEDTLLKDTTGSFADWVASFIRRVIQLLENLPEEDAAGGESEGDVRSLSYTCHTDFRSLV